MLKNFPTTNIFTKHNSAINLNNYLPLSKNNNRTKKNYKFNDFNPTPSEIEFSSQKTRNYKTPDRQYNSKITNSCINLNLENMPQSLRNPKKSESFFSFQNNSKTSSNSLLNSVRYISSPILNQNNYYKYPFTPNISNNTKKTLILDLDETLVHSAFYPFRIKSDIILKINLDGKYHTIHVLKRPNLDFFLKKVSELFNIIIFTASLQQYAEPLIDILDINKNFKRMFRQNCVKDNGFYIKNLNQIGKDFKDIIIIDNNPMSFVMNKDNGLPIMTWYENMDDNELIKLIPLLEFLSNVSDVRPIINQIVNKEKNEIDFNIVKRHILNQDNNCANEINNKNIVNIEYNNFIVEKNDQNIKKYNNGNTNNNIYNKSSSYNNNYLYNGNDKIYNFLYSNNKIFYSLSNMSYEEIQNEGSVESNKINDFDEYKSNNYIFNNYRKNIVKNKNKTNLFLRTKEIFNISNQNENNKQMENYNNFNNINNNINKFPKTYDDAGNKNEINIHNNYNLFDENTKHIYAMDENKDNKIFLQKRNINKNNSENFNYTANIRINYQKYNKINENSYDEINKTQSQKNVDIEMNNNKHRSNSIVNQKKPKNYNLPNNNNLYSPNQLYKKPINIKEKLKEKNNMIQNIYEPKKLVDTSSKEENKEDNNYRTKIDLRRERLKEMRKKIDEINNDIKKTEDYFFQTQKKNNYQKKGNLYNTNFKTAKNNCNRMNMNYQDENNNENDIEMKTYKAHIMDTDINQNDNKENIDINNKEIIINKKINNSNINIYRNGRIKLLYRHKNNTECTNNKYLKKKEKDFCFQTPDLKKGKIKKNIFKYYTKNFINKSNGRINKSSNQNESENS